MQTKQNNSFIVWATCFVFAAGLFFILTSGVPLVQAGWLKEYAKKTAYSNFTRFGVLLMGGWLLSLYFISRGRFSFPGSKNFSPQNLQMASAIIFVAYAAIFIVIGFLRDAALDTRAYDLGIFSQAVWTTLQGKFLFSSIKGNICLLGDHVSPILLFLTPFYALWEDPRTLLIIQSLAAASFVFPLVYLVRKKTGDSWIGFLFALAFFFYLPIRSSLKEDFHPEVLIEPLIFVAFLALETRKNFLFAVMAFLIMSAKENMPGVIFFLGLYAFFVQKRRGFAFLWMTLSGIVFLIETKLVAPALNQAGYFYQENYTHLMTVKGFFTHVFSLGTLDYIGEVFLPFLFFPFASPTIILCAPILVQNILSSNVVMRSLKFHYLAGMNAFLFIGFLYGLCRLAELHAWFRNKRFWTSVMLFLVVLTSGPSEYYFGWKLAKRMTPESGEIRSLIRAIPKNYSVLTHNSLAGQIPNRMALYQFDHNDIPTKAGLAAKYGADYVILAKDFWEGVKPFEENLAEIEALGYIRETERDGFVILKRGAA